MHRRQPRRIGDRPRFEAASGGAAAGPAPLQEPRRGAPGDPAEADDLARLAASLRALSISSRLALLRHLQVPRALGELEVAPYRRDRDRNPARHLTRQAVEAHLLKLKALGLVQARAGQRDGRPATEYLVNPARVFALLEELRSVALPPAAGGATHGPERDAPAQREPLPQGPALVVAGGPLDGVAFPLRGPGPWVVGRLRGAAIALPYDPFLSRENTRLARAAGSGFAAEALPGARNGTRLNWRPLEPGALAPLRPGDVLGVGRSLLVFREGG